MKSFDNQLDLSLLTTCSRLVFIKVEQGMHPDIGLIARIVSGCVVTLD